MNIERLTEIAEWLEQGAPHRPRSNGATGVTGFNMLHYAMNDVGTDCGTACCIAGAANAFHFDSEGQDWQDYWLDSAAMARELLGLSRPQSDALFYPRDWNGDVGVRNELTYDTDGSPNWDCISPQHAGRVVRHFIATGVVDWNLQEAA